MESAKPINPNSSVEFWTNFAPRYKTTAEELGTYQGAVTCFAMVNTQKPGQRICEVGCGTGVGAFTFASAFLQERGVLVSSDFSPAMVQQYKARFEHSDFASDKNKAIIDDVTDYTKPGSKVNLDAIVSGDFAKFVFACHASGTVLPFPDAWFDGYVSSLVLQLISDPQAQLREAYRVLKPGSRACFTVWGRRENCFNFTVRPLAMKNLGIQQAPDIAPSNFDLGENIDETKKWVLAAGFNRLKVWHQANNMPIFSGEDFVRLMGGFNPDPAQWTEEDKRLRAEMIRVYDEKTGKDTDNLANFELCVILAFKD